MFRLILVYVRVFVMRQYLLLSFHLKIEKLICPVTVNVWHFRRFNLYFFLPLQTKNISEYSLGANLDKTD